MKYFIAVVGLLLLSSATFAQSQEIDARLEALMSKADLQALQNDNPKEYDYLVYTLDKAWYITDFPVQKLDDIKDEYSDINLKSTEHINIYALGMSIDDKSYQYFRINKGDKMLVIRSKEHILKLKELNR